MFQWVNVKEKEIIRIIIQIHIHILLIEVRKKSKEKEEEEEKETGNIYFINDFIAVNKGNDSLQLPKQTNKQISNVTTTSTSNT